MICKQSEKDEAKVIIAEARRYIVKRRSTFLDALFSLQFRPHVGLPVVMSTDGVCIYYSPEFLVTFYHSEGMESVAYGILHLCSHCLLGHLAPREQVEDKALYDVLADYKVNKMLSVLWYGKKYSKKYRKVPDNLSMYASGLPMMAAYKKLKKRKEGADKYFKYAGNLYVDDHELWNCSITDEMEGNGDNQPNAMGESGEKGKNERKYQHTRFSSEQRQAMHKWNQMRHKILKENSQLALEMPELKSCGEENGYNSWDYDDLDASETDYKVILEEFFKKSMAEVENMDEIDHMWYHFGLDYLEDIPLIEPTEEIEQQCEGTLVIAIDTSGSCQYSVCDRFISELQNLMDELRFMEYFKRVVLYQCDDTIQEEVVMEEGSEWDAMVHDFTLKGGGGTDFRPVFEASKQFEDMVGLIYLTDCEGLFPEAEPEYPTLLLMIEENESFCGDFFTIPDWAKNGNI